VPLQVFRICASSIAAADAFCWRVTVMPSVATNFQATRTVLEMPQHLHLRFMRRDVDGVIATEAE
jgi:hypothetical protein